MPLPVLLAVDEDQDVLELAHAGEEIALVLAGTSLSITIERGLLEQVRELHPHAKRALLVPLNAWTDKPSAEAIHGSMALGRIDYYVVRPAGSPDEVLHEALSSFLLEWASDRRIVPHTVHIFGARPHTDWLPPAIARDTGGFLLTGEELPDGSDWPLERRRYSLETSMPGVLAAGDVRHASVKRVASAVGEGSIAARLVHSLFADERLRLGLATETTVSASS